MLLTDRELVLRPPTEADAESIADAARSSYAELAPWMVWARPNYATGDALAWIAGEFGDVHPFVIIEPGGRIVGTCSLNEHDAANKRANLGYWLRSDATGNGYATRATRLLAKHGIEFAKYRRLEILVAVGNEASRAVATRSGAVYEGVARSRLLRDGVSGDAHMFSFVAGDTL